MRKPPTLNANPHTGDVGGELSPPPEEEDIKETPPPAPAQSASAARLDDEKTLNPMP